MEASTIFPFFSFCFSETKPLQGYELIKNTVVVGVFAFFSRLCYGPLLCKGGVGRWYDWRFHHSSSLSFSISDECMYERHACSCIINALLSSVPDTAANIITYFTTTITTFRNITEAITAKRQHPTVAVC